MKDKAETGSIDSNSILPLLKDRFEKNLSRHKGLNWEAIEARILSDTAKLKTLAEMERTGGEPDVIGFDSSNDAYLFVDCSPETPSGRRSLCYDREALDSRKQYKPVSSIKEMAAEMGIELLGEDEYRLLQKLGHFDTKTSSWIETPAEIRKLGGALFGDYRFGRVFIYHNGAESYYAARGFRGLLRV